MLNFSSELPEEPRGHALTLIRCPVLRPLSAVITSGDLTGTATHYYGGRTVPCQDEDCEPCLNGVPWRWHTYVSIWLPTAKRHLLLENTARASEPLILYRKAHGSLRGCGFRAQRVNSRVNARVQIETKPADLEEIKLPDAPDLLKVLSIIWNIPLSKMRATEISRSVPHCQVDPSIPFPHDRTRPKPNGDHENDPALPAEVSGL